MITLTQDDQRWLETAAQKEIQGSRKLAQDGITLFTPDGVGNYGALWTRDFAYMLPLFDYFDPQEARAAIRYLLAGQRFDGVIPDRRQVDGISVYEAGGLRHPVGLPPLDNSAFMVSLVYEYVTRSGDTEFLSEALLPLHWAMQAIPRSTNGLVWNHPTAPHSPYGFTDTVGETGDLLFCSLLDWKAARELTILYGKRNDIEKTKLYQSRMHEIESGIRTLVDSSTGLFYAASQDCRQLDVWGNAFAVAIGFPLAPKQKRRIIKFFAQRYDDVIEKGQVRHLLKNEYWKRMLITIKPGEYQNGGYWATPSGWVLKILASEHPDLAERMLRDLIQDFRARGIHEWVNGDRVNLPHYVASITNTVIAVRELIVEKLLMVK